MKKLLTLSLLAFALTTSAQQKPLTIQQQEATAITTSLQKALQLIHRLDISALKRDTLDIYIGNVYQFIDEKNRVAKADTAKVIKPKLNK